MIEIYVPASMERTSRLRSTSSVDTVAAECLLVFCAQLKCFATALEKEQVFNICCSGVQNTFPHYNDSTSDSTSDSAMRQVCTSHRHWLHGLCLCVGGEAGISASLWIQIWKYWKYFKVLYKVFQNLNFHELLTKHSCHLKNTKTKTETWHQTDLQWCAGVTEVLAQVFEGFPPGQGVSACAKWSGKAQHA